MAHKIKTVEKPHVNADGTRSKTRKDYLVTHRHRGKKTLIGWFTSKKAAETAELEEKTKTFGDRAAQ